jgi:hypothetical protein
MPYLAYHLRPGRVAFAYHLFFEPLEKAIDTVIVFAYHFLGMAQVIKLRLRASGDSPPHVSVFQMLMSVFASIRVLSFVFKFRQPNPDVSGRNGWGGLKSIPDNQRVPTTPSQPSSGFDSVDSAVHNRTNSGLLCTYVHLRTVLSTLVRQNEKIWEWCTRRTQVQFGICKLVTKRVQY